MLYAYGIGMGADLLDENKLAFVNKATATARPLKVVPIFASVAHGALAPARCSQPPHGADGERDITFHKPLATATHVRRIHPCSRYLNEGHEKGSDPTSDRAEE
ncbi:hypothetical protein [Bradyrhizobium sp. STM 3561]|uniref:hypothetical protein n=1 Tax=Bradyrhizobium sp. STM 3561 TaxID=578923 RepID=UPI00388E6A61